MKSIEKKDSKSEPAKKAGRYKLTKGLNIKLSPFATLYRVFNLDSKQVWHAKIIDNQTINEYGLEQALQFNIECLLKSQQCQNIICVQEMFHKAGNTFIIQEQYDKTLVQTVTYQFPLVSGTIQDILCDILSGLLELYRLGYMTRSLRPEHIVSVDNVWKIQSFVLNSQMYPVQSQYCWSSKFASPEDRSKSQELSERLIDEQLVWNVGILGLYMILGPDYSYQQINKDNSIPWAKVKENVGQSLYRFLVKALKVDFKDRMRLTEMYENQMFNHLSGNQAHPFQSYSKFYSEGSEKVAKKQTITLSNENMKKIQILRNDIQRFKYFTEVEKYVQQLPYKNSLDINLIRYLSFKISFENSQKIKNELIIWKRQNPVLRNYQPLKDIEDDLSLFVNKVKQTKINYAKNLKGNQLSKSEVNEIKACFLKEINDEKIPYSEVVDLYMKLAGSIYTLLSRECQKRQNQSKSRTICFYSLAVYLIHYYEIESFDNLNNFFKNGVLSLIKLINDAPTKMIVNLTQKLVKQKFATTNNI